MNDQSANFAAFLRQLAAPMLAALGYDPDHLPLTVRERNLRLQRANGREPRPLPRSLLTTIDLLADQAVTCQRTRSVSARRAFAEWAGELVVAMYYLLHEGDEPHDRGCLELVSALLSAAAERALGPTAADGYEEFDGVLEGIRAELDRGSTIDTVAKQLQPMLEQLAGVDTPFVVVRERSLLTAAAALVAICLAAVLYLP